MLTCTIIWASAWRDKTIPFGLEAFLLLLSTLNIWDLLSLCLRMSVCENRRTFVLVGFFLFQSNDCLLLCLWSHSFSVFKNPFLVLLYLDVINASHSIDFMRSLCIYLFDWYKWFSIDLLPLTLSALHFGKLNCGRRDKNATLGIYRVYLILTFFWLLPELRGSCRFLQTDLGGGFRISWTRGSTKFSFCIFKNQEVAPRKTDIMQEN